MAVDSTKLKLIERTSDGKIREIALNQINNLKAVSGAQYTLVDTVTNNAPANMLVKRVGNSLVVDIAGETGVLEIGDFYAQNATAFSTSGTLPAAGASTAGSSALITAETGAIGATVVGEPIVYAASSSLLAGATTGLGLGTIAAIGGGAVVAGAALGGGGGGSTPVPATPTVSLKNDTGSSASDFITNDAQLDVSAPAAGVTRSYRVDGVAVSEYTPPTTPGPHTVVVIDTNSAGGTASATLTFTLKTSVATPTVALAHDSGRSDSDNVTNDAHLNVSEAAAGVTRTYTVDGGEASASYTAPTTAGEHTVVVTDTDVAGNTSTQTLTFTLETAVPTPVVGLASDTGTSGSDKITHDASLSVSDKAADVVRTYSVDGGEASETYTAPSDHGHHYVVVTDTDAAGNTASTTINFTLVPTVSAPSVSLARDTGSSNSDHVTNDDALNVSAAAAGITRTYAVDGGEDSASYVAPTVNGHHSVVVTDTAADGSSASTTLEFDLLQASYPAPTFHLHSDTGFIATDAVSNNDVVDVANLTAPGWKYSTDGGLNWHAGSGSSFTLAEGSYAAGQILVKQGDLAGNGSTVANSSAIVIDKTAPVGGVDVEPNGNVNDENPDVIYTNAGTISFTGVGAGNYVEFSADNGANWTTLAPGVDTLAVAEGTYAAGQVHWHQVDLAGNVGPEGTNDVDVVFDRTIATPNLSLHVDTGYSDSDGVTKNLTVDVHGLEAGASWQYSTDGGLNWQDGSGSSFTVAAGSYVKDQIQVQQTDLAGNESAVGSNGRTLTFDTTGPVLSLSIDDTGSSNSDGKTHDGIVTVSGLERLFWQYSTDGGTNWHNGTGNSFTLEEGTYADGSIKVKHSDVAGNQTIQALSLGHDLVVDTTAPVAATAEVAGNLTGDETPVITVHAEAGAAVAVEVNGQSYAAVETTNAGEYLVTVADVLADGIYAPTITVTDLAGNQTVATGTPFVVDTGAPVLGLQLHADSGTSDNDGLTNEHLVEVTGLETNVSWRYSTDGGEDWTTVAGDQPHSFVLPADGDYAGKVLVEQTDPAGNVGSATLADTMLDTVAPLPPAFALADDTGLSHKDSVSNNGVMNVSGLEGGAHWEYSLDSGNTWITGEDSSFTLAEGLYAAGTVQVRQYDDAGNYSPVVILGSDVEIDQTNPGDLTFNRLVTNNTIDYPAGVMTGALGKGAAADSVQIVIEGTTYTHGDGHLTIADGEWTLNLAGTTLGEGHYDATWVESDLAGNLVSGTMADALWIANDNVFALANTIDGQHWGELGTVDFGGYVTALGGLELTGDGTVLFDGSPSSSLGEVMIGGVGGEDLGVQLTDGALDIHAGGLLFNGVGITAVSGLAGITADGDLSASAHVSVDAEYLRFLVTASDVAPFAFKPDVSPIEVLENDTTAGGSLSLSDAGVDLNAGYIVVAAEASPFEVQQTLGGESTILVSQQHLRAGFGGEDSVGDVLIDNAHIELSAGMIGMLSINQLYQEQGTYSASEVLTGVFPFMGVSDHTSWTTVSAADSTMAEFVGTDVVITQHDVVAQQGMVDAHDAHIGLSAWGPIFAGDVGIAQTSLGGASVDVSGASIDLEAGAGVFLVDRYVTHADTSVAEGTMGSAIIGQVGLYAYDGDLQAGGAEIHVAAPVVMLKDAGVYQGEDFAVGDVTLSGAGVHVTADHFLASSQPGLDGFYQSAADGNVAVVQYGISAGGTIDAQDAHVDVLGYSDVTAGGFYVEQALIWSGFATGGDIILDGASVNVAGEDISISDSAAVRQLGMFASLGSVEANNVSVSVQGEDVNLGNPGYDGRFEFFPGSLSGLELAGSAKVVETSFWGEDAVHATAASVDVDLTDGGFYAAAVVQAGFFAGNAIDVGSAEVQVHEAAGGDVSAQAIYVAQVGMAAADIDARDVGVHVSLGDAAALDIEGATGTTFIGGGIGIAQAGVSAWSADADFSNAHIEVSAGEGAHLGFYAVTQTDTLTSNPTLQVETHGYGTHSEVVIAIDQTDITAGGAVTLTDASLDVTLGDGAGLTVDGGSVFVKQDDIYASMADVMIDHASVHVAGGADSEILLSPQHWYTVNVTGYQSSYDVTITDTDRWVTYDTYVDGTFITSTTSHDYQTHTTQDSSFLQTASETVGLYDLYGDAYISQFDVTAFTGNIHAHDASVGLTVGDDGRIEAHDVFVSQRNLSAGGEIDATLASAIVQIGANATATLSDVYVDQEWFTAGGDISVAGATAGVQVGAGGDVTMSDPYVSQHDLHAGGDIGASGVLAYVSAGDGANVYFTGTLDSVLIDQERFTAGGNIGASDLVASVTLGDNATLSGDWVDAYQSSFSAGGGIDATAVSALLDFGTTADVSLEGLSVEQYHFTAADGDIDASGAQASVKAGQGSTLFFGEDVGVDQENFTAYDDISVGSAVASVSLGDDASLHADWIYAYQSDLSAGDDIDATAVEAKLEIGTLGDVTLTGLDVEQYHFTADGDIDATGALASVSAGQGSYLTFNDNVYVEQATFSADSISVSGATVAVTLGDNAELHGQWVDVYQTLFSADDGNIDATAVSALLDFGATADVTLAGLSVEQYDFTADGDIDASGALASVSAGQGSHLTFSSDVYVEQSTFDASYDISASGVEASVTLGDNSSLTLDELYVSQYDFDAGGTGSDILATAVGVHVELGDWSDATVTGDVYVAQGHFHDASTIDIGLAHATLSLGEESDITLDSVYVAQSDMTALDEVLATAVSAGIWTDHPSTVQFMAGEDEVVLGVYQGHIEAGDAETRSLHPTTYFSTQVGSYVTAFTGTVDLSEAAVVLSACTVSGTDSALIAIEQATLAAGLLVDLSDASVSVNVDSMAGTLDAIGIYQHDIAVGGRVYEWGECTHNGTPFDAVNASYLTGSVDFSHNVVDVSEGDSFYATAVGISRADVTAGLSIGASHNELTLVADSVHVSAFDYILAQADARTIDASYNTLHLKAGEGDAEVDEVMLGVMDAASKFLTVNHNLIEVEAWDDDDGEVTANYVGVDVDSRLQSGSSSNHVDVSDNRIRIVADEDVTIGYVGYDVTVASATLHADHNEIYVSAGDDVTIGELHNIDVTAASLLTGSSVEHNDVFVTADDNIWVTHFDQAGTDAHATFWGNSVSIDSLQQASAGSEHLSIFAQDVDVTLHSSANHIDEINVQQQDVERLDSNVIDWWSADVTLEAATASTVHIDSIAVDYAQAFMHFDMGATSGSYLFDVTALDVGVAVNNENSTWGSSNPVHDANLQYDLIDLHDLGITSTTQLTLGSWSIDDRLGDASATEHIFDELQFYGTGTNGATVQFTLDDLHLDSSLLSDMNGSGAGTPSFWSVAAGQDQANAVWTMVEQYVLHLGSGVTPT